MRPACHGTPHHDLGLAFDEERFAKGVLGCGDLIEQRFEVGQSPDEAKYQPDVIRLCQPDGKARDAGVMLSNHCYRRAEGSLVR
jgi:hypothetical protein